MKDSRFLAALAAATAVAAFTAAQASAATPKLAHFKVTVRGSQSTKWTLDHTEYDGCVQGQVRQTGSGQESLSFKSRKPATASAVKLGRTTTFAAFSGSTPGARVKGSVTRSGHAESQQLSGNGPGCGGGGGGPAPTPDCGTRAFSGSVDMNWVSPAEWPGGPPVPLTSVLLLEGPQVGGTGLSGMFQDCPGGGPDQLIPTVGSALSSKKLFGKAKHFTIRGKDTDTTDDNGFHSDTSVHWVAKFTRLGGAFKPPKPQARPQCSDGLDNNGNGKIDYPQDPGCSSPTDNSE